MTESSQRSRGAISFLFYALLFLVVALLSFDLATRHLTPESSMLTSIVMLLAMSTLISDHGKAVDRVRLSATWKRVVGYALPAGQALAGLAALAVLLSAIQHWSGAAQLAYALAGLGCALWSVAFGALGVGSIRAARTAADQDPEPDGDRG